MDWLALSAGMPRDRDFPERTWRLDALTRVLDGCQYDHLPHPFSTEKTPADGYVPLDKRRPSVRAGLCRVVVDDAVSLLFSEGHFPAIHADAPATAEALTDAAKSLALNATLLDAATRGAVGSVAILMRVLKQRPFFSVMPTPYLTPEWAADDPETLVSVREKRKVDAADLAAAGWNVKPDAGVHWFMRVWDTENENWFLPWPVAEDAPPRIDASRSVRHGLGFVPMVWVRNLPGGTDVDGSCTFTAGIDTAIEADYLLSQAGRGLKYSSDPTLVLKSPGSELDGMTPARVGGSATVLEVPPEGDAKLLEINGTAAAAVLAHVEMLRGIALEAMHGNRANADKLSAAQSGRAMELMNQGLIWLADRLRISYGEGALLSLLRMLCQASERVKGGLVIGRGAQQKAYANLNSAGLLLKWAPWYAPTYADQQTQAEALGTALDKGIISRETATGAIAPTYDIEDIPAELARIAGDLAAQDAREIAVGAAVKVAATAAV